MYSAEKILWIKNIKRNDGESWAYDAAACGKDFYLNWSSEKSASIPKIGEIIVLFQKPLEVDGKKNYHVRFTHLVSPISNEILIDPKSPKHKYIRKMELIALADPISSLPNPGYFNFLKPNRGPTNRITNLTNNIGLTEIQTKETIWNLFKNHLCISIFDKIHEADQPIGIFGEVEGDRFIRKHIKQEIIKRNSKIVQLAKSNAFNNGKLYCECCDFDFFKAYGQLGFKFIECHHKFFISHGERVATLEDLALVCSNCHRMLHRKKDDGSYYDVESLSIIIKEFKI